MGDWPPETWHRTAVNYLNEVPCSEFSPDRTFTVSNAAMNRVLVLTTLLVRHCSAFKFHR